MKLLFLTLLNFDSIEEHNLYTDLLREFYRHGHDIYVVSPVERRYHKPTLYKDIDSRQHILKLRIGNTQKTNIVEKGISTVTLEHTFIRGIRKYMGNVKFDLIIYSTPPITLQRAVAYVKKRDQAHTYLLLKDIFPQNALDLGMLQTRGVKGILYRYFRNKEKRLYALSDRIGCMSEANRKYVIEHNPEINPGIVEICPNSIEVCAHSLMQRERDAIREKYGLPKDRTVFIYGGNLGKPQGIPFLIECLRAEKVNKKAYFLIVGDGTEYGKLEHFFQEEKPENMQLIQRLPREEFEQLVAACDVGMIFLDYRFTIPNFPSRLLSYMQAAIPVLACTDPNTDIGEVITDGGFGWWCKSNDVNAFRGTIDGICDGYKEPKGLNGYDLLKKEYSSEVGYKIIMKLVMNKMQT